MLSRKFIMVSVLMGWVCSSFQQSFPFSSRGCVIVTKNQQAITVNSSIMASANSLALQIAMTERRLDDQLNLRVTIDDESGKFFVVDHMPANVTAEVQSADFVEVLVKLLNEIFEVPANTTATYSGTIPTASCKASTGRIAADSPTGNCKASDAYTHYQIQGACLDKNRPGIGLAQRAMVRIGVPYCTSDGESSLCPLPSARNVSLVLQKVLEHTPASRTAPVPSMLTLSWAQFVIHETTQGQLIGNVKGGNATAACASNKRQLARILSSPYVNNIEVDCEDPFYKQFQVHCLNFVRNRRLNEKCLIQTAPFLNSAPPTLDLDTIYSHFDESLETFVSNEGTGGKLLKDEDGNIKIFHHNNRQHTLVALVSILIGKMHDRIVVELKRLRPSLSDSDAYKTAKKINIAFCQHVWYRRLLVTFIGSNNDFVGNSDNLFDSSVTPAMLIENSAAAGRFPHVFVADNVTMVDPVTFATVKVVPLIETFGNVALANSNFKSLVCGSASQQWRTGGLSEVMQNKMFFDKKLNYGVDMFSIDVERARDACLEPYINYLARLFGICVKTWADLTPFLSAKALQLFPTIYRRVQDLELYPAGLAEKLVDDSVMGKVFTEIQRLQYRMLKVGDPKFYSNFPSVSQRNMVRRITFTNYICIAAELEMALPEMRISMNPNNRPQKCPCRNFADPDCFDLSVFLP